MISLALLLALASSPPAPTTASPPASPTSAAPWTAPPSFEPRWLSARPARAPQRIVTVAPSLTELVFALGAGARVVGVTQFDDFPPEVTRLPRIGGFLDPSVERILELRADLVIAAPNASNRVPLDRLVALGVPVLVVPGNGFADLLPRPPSHRGGAGRRGAGARRGAVAEPRRRAARAHGAGAHAATGGAGLRS
jgi:ABC-type Fe3+-hydroxamate transport system substrate-binding protein